jgi:hypothetical protein
MYSLVSLLKGHDRTLSERLRLLLVARTAILLILIPSVLPPNTVLYDGDVLLQLHYLPTRAHRGLVLYGSDSTHHQGLVVLDWGGTLVLDG